MIIEDLCEAPRFLGTLGRAARNAGAVASGAARLGTAGIGAAAASGANALKGTLKGFSDHLSAMANTAALNMGSDVARHKLMVAAATRDMMKRWKTWSYYNNNAPAVPENLISFLTSTYDITKGAKKAELETVIRDVALKAGLTVTDRRTGGGFDKESDFAGISPAARARLASAKQQGMSDRGMAYLMKVEKDFAKHDYASLSDFNAKWFGKASHDVFAGSDEKVLDRYLRGLNIAASSDSDKATRLQAAKQSGVLTNPALRIEITRIERALADTTTNAKTMAASLKEPHDRLRQAAAKTGNRDLMKGVNTYLSQVGSAIQSRRSTMGESVEALDEAPSGDPRPVDRATMQNFFTKVAMVLVGAGFIKVTGVDQKLRDQGSDATGYRATSDYGATRGAATPEPEDNPVTKVNLVDAVRAAATELRVSEREIFNTLQDIKLAVGNNPESNWRHAIGKLSTDERKKIANFLFTYMIGKAKEVG